MEQRPIVIIDGFNIFVRHFAANEAVTTSGDPCGGIVGFLKALYGLTIQFSPAKIYVVWEQGGGCPRRKKLYPAYKANRTKQKEDFKNINLSSGEKPGNRWILEDQENKLKQVKTLVESLKHLPVCQLYVADTECDDVIGYLIRTKLKSQPALKILVSSDRDFYQLLDEPDVKIFNPADKSFHSGPLVRVKLSPTEAIDIPARNYALIRTLTGDASDNISGIPGLGFKTALKLFPSLLNDQEDHTIEALIVSAKSHLMDKKPKKAYQSVAAGEDVIRRNWHLMYLSSATLAYNQITKIEYTVDNFEPKIDKLGLIKSLLRAGVVSTLDFDAVTYQMQVCLLRP